MRLHFLPMSYNNLVLSSCVQKTLCTFKLCAVHTVYRQSPAVHASDTPVLPISVWEDPSGDFHLHSNKNKHTVKSFFKPNETLWYGYVRSINLWNSNPSSKHWLLILETAFSLKVLFVWPIHQPQPSHYLDYCSWKKTTIVCV